MPSKFLQSYLNHVEDRQRTNMVTSFQIKKREVLKFLTDEIAHLSYYGQCRLS